MYHLQNTETYIVSQNKRKKVVHTCRLPEYSEQPESVFPVPQPSAAVSTQSLPSTRRRRRSTTQRSASSTVSTATLPTTVQQMPPPITGQATAQQAAAAQLPPGSGARPKTRSTRSTSSSLASLASTEQGSTSTLSGPLRPSVHPLDAEPRGYIGQNILRGADQLASDEVLAQQEEDVWPTEQLEEPR